MKGIGLCLRASHMTRPLLHVGLVLAIAVAPALCCCKVRGLGAAAHAAHAPAPSHPSRIPPPVESCCGKSCCHRTAEPPAAPTEPDPKPKPKPKPAPGPCCAERPDAVQTESTPAPADAEPTGELLPLPHDAPAGAPEHRGSDRGARPPDAKSAALFDRHVMHC